MLKSLPYFRWCKINFRVSIFKGSLNTNTWNQGIFLNFGRITRSWLIWLLNTRRAPFQSAFWSNLKQALKSLYDTWKNKRQKKKKKRKFGKAYNVKLTNIFTNVRAHYFFGKTKTMIRKKKTFKYILGILSIFGKCLFPKSHPLLCFFGSAHFRLPPAFIRHMSMKDCQKLSRNDYYSRVNMDVPLSFRIM